MVRADAIETEPAPHCEHAVSAFLPKSAVVLLCQDGTHILTPAVTKGCIVTEGQLLGFDPAGEAASVHSPIPGQITGFLQMPSLSGKMVPAVMINLTGSFTFLGKKNTGLNWMFLSTAQRQRQLIDRGVINTFRDSCSLGAEIALQIPRNQVLIVRLYDKSPDCHTDSFITGAYYEKVLEGAAITADTMNAKYAVFLYPSGREDLIPDTKRQQELFPAMQVVFVPANTALYPSGTVHEIIRTVKLYAKRTHLSTLPKDITSNDIFIDSTTALSVYDALVCGIPVIERIIQVSGNALQQHGIFRVKIGTSIRKILEECGKFVEPVAKIIVNGVLDGYAVCDIDTPITKEIKSVSVLSTRTFPDQTQNECIRCGMCRSVCPNKLHPETVYANYISGELPTDTTKATVSLCSQCALCSAACPSRIPLNQIIKLVKGQIS